MVTLRSGSGGGSVSAMGSPAKLAVPRPSKSATQALPSRRDGNRTAPAPRSKKVRGDRLRDGAATGGDLAQIEVLQVVLEQQFDVAILDLLACGHVGEIDQGAIELQDCGNEGVLYAPLRSDRLLSEVLGSLRSVALNMAAQRAEVRPEVG